ncbi:HlyD family type I secretion periplasmic adaptor subunit [Ursidibacter arcticus]
MKLGLQAFGDLIKRYCRVFKAVWAERKQLEIPDRKADESAFLPAHLELTETPVSALPKWSARLIMFFLLLAVIWATIGKVEIVAVAEGKITASSRSKVIQPLETALVKKVWVKNGDRVQQDQLLMELTAMGVEVDFSKSEELLKTTKLSQLRLKALLYAITHQQSPILVADEQYKRLFLDEILQLEQEQQLATQQYTTWLSQTKRQLAVIEQKRQEQQTIQINITKLTDIQKFELERRDDLLKLYKKASASKHEYYQQENRLLEVQNSIETQKSRLTELIKQIEQSEQEYQVFLNSFKRDVLDELKKVTDSLAQTEFELEKAKQRQQFMQIRSPIDGVVQQLQAYTIGGVVTTAQTLMVIAPEQDNLEIEAMITNEDMGFVKTGQDVIIKVRAFPYTRYGYITGTVKNISLDAIHNEKLGYVFSTTISMNRNALIVEGQTIPLKQGMVVTAEIKTGKRSVMDYLLSPLKTTIDESLRER